MCEDEASSHGDHEILIGTLHDYSALAEPHPLLDRVGDLRTPNAVCVVNHMIQSIFLGQFAELVDFVWYPWGEAAGCRRYRQDILCPKLQYLLLEASKISGEMIFTLLELDADGGEVRSYDCFQACLLVDARPEHILAVWTLFR